MNKKAGLSAITEMILALCLIMGCLLLIVNDLNVKYHQNNNPTYGISSNNTLDAFKNSQDSVKTGLAGEATTNEVLGLSVVSSWGLAKALIGLVFEFVNGQWIQNAVALLNLGAIGQTVGLVLRLLYILAVAYIFLTIVFKVRP
jgi:hypothetical protein